LLEQLEFFLGFFDALFRRLSFRCPALRGLRCALLLGFQRPQALFGRGDLFLPRFVPRRGLLGGLPLLLVGYFSLLLGFGVGDLLLLLCLFGGRLLFFLGLLGGDLLGLLVLFLLLLCLLIGNLLVLLRLRLRLLLLLLQLPARAVQLLGRVRLRLGRARRALLGVGQGFLRSGQGFRRRGLGLLRAGGPLLGGLQLGLATARRQGEYANMSRPWRRTGRGSRVTCTAHGATPSGRKQHQRHRQLPWVLCGIALMCGGPDQRRREVRQDAVLRLRSDAWGARVARQCDVPPTAERRCSNARRRHRGARAPANANMSSHRSW